MFRRNMDVPFFYLKTVSFANNLVYNIKVGGSQSSFAALFLLHKLRFYNEVDICTESIK